MTKKRSQQTTASNGYAPVGIVQSLVSPLGQFSTGQPPKLGYRDLSHRVLLIFLAVGALARSMMSRSFRMSASLFLVLAGAFCASDLVGVFVGFDLVAMGIQRLTPRLSLGEQSWSFRKRVRSCLR